MNYKRRYPLFILVVLLVFLSSLQSVNASGVNEYLLEGEISGNLLMKIDISNEIYSVYDIVGSKDHNLLVIGPTGETIEGDLAKKVLFTYFTSKYLSDNRDIIKENYDKTYDELSDMSNSDMQKVLKAIKEMNNLCIDIPKLEIISICFNPSERLEITWKTGSIIFSDWGEVYDKYKEVGGETFRIINSKNLKYTTVIEFYKDYKSAEILLNKSDLLGAYSVLREDIVHTYSSDKTMNEINLIKERILELKNSEAKIYKSSKTLLSETKRDIEEIVKMDGNISDIKGELEEIKNDLQEVNVNDKFYTSDINNLKILQEKIASLKSKSNLRLDETREDYYSSGDFSRVLKKVRGFIRSFLFSFEFT